jgi:hypothetical protein
VPNLGERSVVVKHDVTFIGTDAQLLPKFAEVHAVGLHPHLSIQLGQDGCPGGMVPNCEGPGDWPFLVDSSTGGNNRAQRILKSPAVTCLFAYGDIRHQAKEGAAPVGARPCVSLIQAVSEGLGSPLGMSLIMSPHILSGDRVPVCARAIGSI